MDKVNKKSIYLDYNATTPLEDEVLSAIHDALRDAWGNPSSSHDAGKKAKAVIDQARSCIAEMINAVSQDIIFTSGGTEANNLVIHTAMKHFHDTFPQSHGSPCLPHIITSNLEHDSVKLVIDNFVDEEKIEASFIPASKLTGHVEVEDIIAAVRPNTCLVTIMMANNETGVIQPITEIMKAVKLLNRDPKTELPRILLHTDAAQAIGKICVDTQELGVDYLTVVGHKFYAPRIGALFVKGPGKSTPLSPMFYGGGQERNFRPGTENTGMIAGLGKAAELVVKNIDQYEKHMREVRDYLEDRLTKIFGERVHFNGRFENSKRIPNTCNVSIRGEGLQGNKILKCTKHIQASVGAACHSDLHSKPSHILLAVGIPYDIATNALRLSVGRHTSKEDIDVVVEDIREAIEHLQQS
ncbi:selenocysteine lyase-like [Glandiceps talaboti]